MRVSETNVVFLFILFSEQVSYPQSPILLSTFIEKRDKPELEKILLYFKGRNFLSNNDVFFEEIQKVTG